MIRALRPAPVSLALSVALAAGCAVQGGTTWVEQGEGAAALARGGDGWIKAPPPPRRGGDLNAEMKEATAAARISAQADDEPAEVLVREHGRAAAAGVAAVADVFRNTYYDFPREGQGTRDATVYDASCAPIAPVTRAFHDAVCVQGSGRLASGATVSFARRGCPCADVCPRTGQRVCFERLDPARFPHGRGAMGTAITPLRTVAVDSEVIPLGTPVFIPELAGLPLPDGAPHDGCFLAEDRGIKVVGRQVDVFTGDPATTARWNALFPSNRGVHVVPGEPRCARRERPQVR